MSQFQQDEDDDEIFHESTYKSVLDALLITIDMSASMLTSPPNPSCDEGKRRKKSQNDHFCISPAVAALKCAYDLMKQRIITNPKDKMGVLLYGTDKTKAIKDDEGNADGNTYSHCYVLVDLDVPSASDVKRLGDLIDFAENRKTGDDVEPELALLLRPAKQHPPMATVFLCANQLFSSRAPRFVSRRMFIVTDNDKPHAGNKDAIAAATVRAKDLFDSGVLIDLFPIIPASAPPGTTFDRAAFYSDIAYGMSGEGVVAPIGAVGVPSGEEEFQKRNGISLLSSLLSSITSRAVSKRALMNASMILGPSLIISIRGFVNLKRQAPVRSSYVWLHGSEPRLVQSSTTRIAEDTGRTINFSDEIRKAFRFGGATVPFSKEEISRLRKFEAEELKMSGPFLRIVGFKSQDELPPWARVRAPTFLYPSEHGYSGSTRVFAALFQSLREKKKMAIAWCLLRQTSAPMLAALVPTAADPDRASEGTTVVESSSPQGLYLVPLPFAEDLRQVPDNMTTVPPTELFNSSAVGPLCDIIRLLNLPGMAYDPSRYPNPSLQQFYSILRALALDEDLPDDVKDWTLPRYNQLDKRVGEQLQACMKLIERDARNIQSKFTKRASSPFELDSKTGLMEKKLKTASSAISGPVRQSASSQDELPTDEQMQACYRAGTLDKYTVAVLKAWVKSKEGLANVASTAKRKNDWIACVEAYFDVKR